MPAFLCETCGTQFAPSAAPPPACPICEDERQFVPAGGQRWLTLEELRGGHANAWRRMEPGLFSLATAPSFAIGQRAFLLRRPQGNVLWDCLSLIDAATVELIQALGGLSAIAISHPHFYGCMAEWAAAFDAPVWLHAADRPWVMHEDPRLRFWSGPTQTLGEGLTLIHALGHFDGSAALHWADGAEGRGVLLSGDTVMVAVDRKNVALLRSFPNGLPLGPNAVRRTAEALEPYPFERIYAAFPGRDLMADAKGTFTRSVARTLRWLAD
jgi:glyoxylase-like metal-dependent hydrolase (beta-lactamase superfamily II)